MGKKAHYNYKEETKDMSGKNDMPGQYRLDLNEDGNRLVEQRPQLCKPYFSQRYWGAFKEFLDASGVFNRTWYLYKQIQADPSPEELNRQIGAAEAKNDIALKNRLESQLEDVVKRLTVMKAHQGCETAEELYVKAEKEWNAYKAKLKNLIYYAGKANVPINAKDGDKTFRGIMYAFVLLDDKIRGSCRREFYRKKYVDIALKRINQTHYSDPISIYEIEQEYKADKKWQEKYLRRKRKK